MRKYYRSLGRRYCRVWISLIVGTLLLAVGIGGCKGTTINPTEPVVDPTPNPDIPTPVPSGTPTVPAGDATPTPIPPGTPTAPADEATPTPVSPSYDGYADTPDDPTIKTLEAAEASYEVTLEYTGDIDWYKIAVPEDAATLSIELFDIPTQSDFDIVAYDETLTELINGRSTQAGNVSELIEIDEPGELVYLQIYSYSGRGNAKLSITATTEETPDIEHLTYENVLSTEYSLYPRGSFSGLLERHVETETVENVTCQGVLSSLEGTLTIGTYAHVERNILTLTDYIDGWALAVFNGTVQNFDEMMISIRVSIASEELGLTVNAPPDMRVQGGQYLKSNTKDDVYYVVVTYGDLWANTTNDIRMSSGVVGDLGTLLSNEIFAQEVTTDWSVRLPDGTRCSGEAEGSPIEDFETSKLAIPSFKPFQRIW